MRQRGKEYAMPEFKRMSHTRAEIYCRLNAGARLLDVFGWEDGDHAPLFPELNRYLLEALEPQLDGRIHSVKVAMPGIFEATEIK